MAIINVPDDTYKRLEVRAAAIGIPVDQFVVPLLDQMVPPAVDQRQRQRAFANLITLIHLNAVQYPPDQVLDTSRDAIYDDRLRSQL